MHNDAIARAMRRLKIQLHTYRGSLMKLCVN